MYYAFRSNDEVESIGLLQHRIVPIRNALPNRSAPRVNGGTSIRELINPSRLLILEAPRRRPFYDLQIRNVIQAPP